MMASMSTHQQCVSQKDTLPQQFCAVEKGGGKFSRGLDGHGCGLSEVRSYLGPYGSGSAGCGCVSSSFCCCDRYEDFDSSEILFGQSFPSELDEVSIDSLLPDQTGFCLESMVGDANFKDLLEINFDFNDYLQTDQTLKKVDSFKENDWVCSLFPSPSLKHDVCTDNEVLSIQKPLYFDKLPSQNLEINPLFSSDTISEPYHHLDDFLGNLNSFDASESFFTSFVDSPKSPFMDLPSSFEASFVSSESSSFSPITSAFTSLYSHHSSHSILSSSPHQLPILSSFSSHQPLSSSFSSISSLPFQLSSSSSQPPSNQPSSYKIISTPSSLSTQSTLSSSSLSPSSLSPSPPSSSLVHRPEKHVRKMEQNKTAALRYRQKKREERGNFMQEYDFIEHRNTELKNKVSEITKEINYLKSLMSEISNALNES